MSIYIEPNIKITKDLIKIKGIILPKISNISFEYCDIKSIHIVKITPRTRFNLLRTNDLKTWWSFDKFRMIKRKGIIIELNKALGPIQKIGFTVSDIDSAIQVLRSNGQEIIYQN